MGLNNNNLNKILYILCFLLLIPQIAFANNIQEITGTGIYILKENETKSDGEKRALLNASNNAAEKTIIYIKTYSQIKHYKLTDKELIQINSYAINIKNINYQWDFANNTKQVICNATFEFDTDLEKYITSLKDNKSLKEQNQSLIAENESLHHHYTLAYRTTNQDALNAYQEGLLLNDEHLYEQASKKFEQAINIDNKDVVLQEAYFESLLNCLKIHACKIAIDNFAKVQPDYFKNANYYYYYGTGTLLSVIELEYITNIHDTNPGAKSAIIDFLQALNYNCDKKDIYAKLATAYMYTKKDSTNISKDYLNFSNYKGKWYYFALGRIYNKSKNYQKAITNFELAIQQDHLFIEAWYNCGYIEFKRKNYNVAKEYMKQGHTIGTHFGGNYKYHSYAGIFN